MLIKSIMWDTNNDNEALASLPDEIETPNNKKRKTIL